MATSIVSRQTVGGDPHAREVEFLTDPQEVEFLRLWRAADDEGKRNIDKVLRAAAAGLLPDVGTINAMTQAERGAFIASLPEAQS